MARPLVLIAALALAVAAGSETETIKLASLGAKRKDRLLHIACGKDEVAVDDTYEWTHNDKPVDPVKDTRVTIEDVTDKKANKKRGELRMSHVDELDAGYWKCTVVKKAGDKLRHIYHLLTVPKAIRTDRKSVTVTEGELATMSCDVYGSPPPTVWWTKRAVDNVDPDEGEDDEDEDDESASEESASEEIVVEEELMEAGGRFTLDKNAHGVENAVLRINDTVKGDRAYYFCHAKNKHGVDSTKILLRVKDKLAALWPFIGIVIEVIILLIIIFIFERRQAAKQREIEEEGAQSDAKAKLTGDDSELRQRTGVAA